MKRGLPKALILQLQAHYHIETFIETGTFQAKTARWAAQHFKTVLTIEQAKSLYDKVAALPVKNITFIYGDSRQHLVPIVNELIQPAIFWLDGHWSGSETYGKEDECPLLEEIAALNTSPVMHFILIDDARLFLAPPPYPHQREAWPEIETVIKALKTRHPYQIIIFQDVIVAVPPQAYPFVREYCQQVATEAFQAQTKEIKQGILMIGMGMKSVFYGLYHQMRTLWSRPQ